ncbi:hypothetical protein AGMMS50262_21650 [Bacteroidia bacterium]|nr:hypothetical protein AGMMS50262_21650 [Bacteroidia bacterium]
MKTEKLFLIGCVFVWMANTVNAQSYQAGASLNNENTNWSGKTELPVAGEKFTQVLFTQPDYENPAPSLAEINVYNPDFSLFKKFQYTLPAEFYLFVHHGGVEIAENKKSNGEKEYFSIFNVEGPFEFDEESIQTVWDKLHILNEANEVIGAYETSWMGYKVFYNDGKPKLATQIQSWGDTIFSENGWWRDGNLQTGHIYDVATGQEEKVFPTGTEISGIYTIDGEERITTQSNNLRLYYQGQISAREQALKMTIYNKDYSVYKTLDGNFTIPEKTNNLGYNAAHSYKPIGGGNKLYYTHFINYLIIENYQQVGSDEISYLVDENGNLIKEKKGRNLYYELNGAVYLPSQQKDYILGYDSIYSLPDLTAVTAYTQVLKDDAQNIKIVRKEANGTITILNDDFSVYKTVTPPENWTFVNAFRNNITKSGTIELAFFKAEVGEKGLLILTETGATLVEIPDFESPEYYDSYSNIIALHASGEKYGRLVDNATTLFSRTNNLTVNPKVNAQEANVDIQLYRQTDNGLVLDTTKTAANGTAVFSAGEGTYYLKAIGETVNATNTYYPSALTWEDATAVVFSTDNAEQYNLALNALPLALPTTNTGSVSGTVTQNFVHSSNPLRADNQDLYPLYLVNRSNGTLIAATQSGADGDYSFDHLAEGSYNVLIDVPGKPITSLNAVTLSSGNMNLGNINYEITDTEVIGSHPTGIAPISRNISLTLYPNPVSDYLYLQSATPIDNVEIYSLTGQLLKRETAVKEKIAVSTLPAGVYMVKVQTGNEVLSSKIVVKK